MKAMLFFLFLVVTTSCYRMPEEGEVSTLPTTNNPSLTRKPNQTVMPSIEY